MSQAGVLQLVSDLAYGQSDAANVADFYTHVVEDLARYPWMTNASLVATVAGTSEYVLASTQVKLLAVFFDNKQLARLTVQEASVLDPQWRDRSGFPFAYVVEAEPQKTFRLYPNPDTASKAFSFPTGQPLGLDFPAYSVVVFHTETRTNVLPWLELPVALEVLAREFERESNHRDLEFSGLARQLGAILFSMVA